MSANYKARELALQVLFLWDANAQADDALALQAISNAPHDPAVVSRAIQMARAAWDMRSLSDESTLRLAPQWPPHRQPGVDRAILRLAIWEFNSDTPPKVVIDEAIELAKEFSTKDSPAFVNGVLDAVLRERKALISTPSGE